MSGFWASDDKIPVQQTKVSIPAENGLNYTDGQTIHIHVPPTIDYIQPRETYLRVDCLIDDDSSMTRLCLDKIGGSCLIRDIRIFSGGAGGVLLEEIQGYNVLASLKHSYEQNESLRNKRELVEGGQNHNSKCRSDVGGIKCEINNVPDSSFVDAFEDSNASQTTVLDNKLVKLLLPLHTGIFQNNKVFPCLLTSGLRLEILLEDAPRIVRCLEQVSLTNHLNANMLFHSCEGTASPGSGGVDGDVGTTGRWTGTDTITSIWVRRNNGQYTAANFPLRIGEAFNLVDNTKDFTGSGASLTDAMVSFNTGDGSGLLKVGSIKHYAAQGNDTSVGGHWGLTEIVLQSAATKVGGLVCDGTSGDVSIISQGIQSRGATWKPTITLSNVALITQQVEMPPQYTSKLMGMMKEGGVLNYGFLSYTNYRYSQLASDVVANIRLPLQESKCKAILAIPTDSSVYTNTQLALGYDGSFPDTTAATTDYPAFTASTFTYDNKNVSGEDKVNFSTRSGLVGIWDYLTEYQWFYDGRLNPNRKVDTSQVSKGTSLSQQWAIEGEKALAMSGIKPLSFRDVHENAFIGRAVALQDGVYDARGRDFNLQVQYSSRTSAGVSQPPVKNKLWNCFSAHLRTIMVKGDQISVQV